MNLLLDQHAHRGLSLSRLARMKARTLAKFMAMSLRAPIERHKRLRTFDRFRRTGVGREAIVVGLGPTARTLDARALASRQVAGELDVFCLNGFCETSLAEDLVPKYYVLADPRFFDFDETTTMPNSTLRPTVVWEYLRAEPEITVFIPHRYEAPEDFDRSRLVYFNGLGLEGFSGNVDAKRPRGYLSMAAYSALACAVSMSYDRTLIAGIENSWYSALALTSGGHVALRSHHAYDVDSDSLHELEFFADGGVPAFFEDISRLFGDLYLFRGHGVENLDTRTVIDAFPIAADAFDFMVTDD